MAAIHDVKRCIIASDWHVPFHHKLNVSAMFEFARDYKPHAAVIAGDFLDMPEFSKHNSGSVAERAGLRLVDSFAAGNDVLDRFDRALGRMCQERVYLNGNHEHRVQRWLKTGDNAFLLGDPLVDIGVRLNLKKRRYNHIQEYPKGLYSLGRLHVIHGFYCGMHAAYTHVSKYGCNVMFGHTHRSGLYLAPTIVGQRGGYALGHMADEESPNLKYGSPIHGWSEGFGIASVRKSGNFQADLINLVDGVFYYGGRQYGDLREAA